MRYENLITHKLALFDLPAIKYDQIKPKGRHSAYLHKIFKQLLIYDQLPDDDLNSVLRETKYSLDTPDPGFEALFHNDFENFISSDTCKFIWQKIRKDYNRYIRSETKRRNSENPYYNAVPETVQTWDGLPDTSRLKLNQPWQFDSLYRDSQIISSQIFELSKDYKEKQDKDLFRAKVNGILVPDKIIFALNSGEHSHAFGENELTAINTKLTLDAYKLSFTFLNRIIESLHKIRWGSEQPEVLDRLISSADKLSERLKLRIAETERRFILFIDAISDQRGEDE